MFSTESMKKLRVFLAPLLFSLANAGEIEVCVRARKVGVSTVLSGARVECFDEDWDDDDVLTIGTTGSDGCARLSYETRRPKFWNPCAGWDCKGFSDPDIYCKITKPGYFPLFTNTKEDWDQDDKAKFDTLNIYPLRRCWKQKDFGGQTCSDGERITQYSTTLEQCKTDCELDSGCEFIYWQSEEKTALDGPLCHRYRSCNLKQPAAGGTNHQVDDCSDGLANGCGPESDWEMFEGMTTFLLDGLTGFARQCTNHDLCYLDCNETQESCDKEMLDLTFSECNDRVEVSVKGACKLLARTMHGAVSSFGADAHFTAQQAAGCIAKCNF